MVQDRYTIRTYVDCHVSSTSTLYGITVGEDGKITVVRGFCIKTMVFPP